jgi:hypothetical protein
MAIPKGRPWDRIYLAIIASALLLLWARSLYT